MARVGIVKPDHLGDLILASPAIRGILNWYGSNSVDLYIASACMPLADYLFPGARKYCSDFRHLSRGIVSNFDSTSLVGQLAKYDLVFCLRDDPQMRRLIASLQTQTEIINGDHRVHDTWIHKRTVCKRIPNYSRTVNFTDHVIAWPQDIQHIGLCISAGFPTNRWPNINWLQLATLLSRDGIKVSLIGGPKERADLALLSALLTNRAHRVIQGGSDFGAFFAELKTIDVVVASDGGTGHLCSLVKPMISLFSASPWRRYAPFGRSNLVLTMDLPCSPCVQFSTNEVNCCVTRECVSRISPSAVYTAILSHGEDFSRIRELHVQRGTSHAFNFYPSEYDN